MIFPPERTTVKDRIILNKPKSPFTATERKILAILGDGMPHKRDELLGCLPDDLGSPRNIHPHFVNIRTHIRPKGMDIITQLIGRTLYYRWVRLIGPVDY